jgi:hypothetical protein
MTCAANAVMGTESRFSPTGGQVAEVLPSPLLL